MVTDDAPKAPLKLLEFPGVPRLPLAAETILKKVPEGMDTVVVLGWDKDGDFFFASSEPSGPEVVWLLEQAKFALLYGARALSGEDEG